jgi:hypothetical protein
MRSLSEALGLMLAAIGLASVGCQSARNAEYCDEETPCASSEFSYCDLTGAFGSKNGCVKPPPDAAPSRPDAATSGPCAGVDCSALDDECSLGVCDPETGECVSEPANEGDACGEFVSCEEFGSCSYGSTCARVGSKSRQCVDYACQAGACAASEPRTDLADCGARSTTGNDCAASGCGACQYSGCDATGERSCSSCSSCNSSGSCVASGACIRACSRNPTGAICGASPCPDGARPLCCSAAGVCNVSCGECP